ncbi:hypothetical protein MTQ01_16750 [Streptomyces sp. XM4193]|uniref:hypothetical protein n=1 Tax=Streptomyces sp. XM4193 TaxID=2929782 RepID=UPI001FF83A41|nr:hypothetical protein [Streptomyces sp. XM4193]MCK1797644.1 hypothetical protein [Streptomyces sp. XM4193]
MSKINKAKSFKKSKAGTYLSIGTTLFGAVSIAKQVKTARLEHDKLQLVDAVVSAAAVATGIALLVRELRRISNEGDLDVLAD